MSVRNVSKQYERLTRKSGLELNADKTEILCLHSPIITNCNVNYNGDLFQLKTLNEIKICGIWFCNNLNREYHLNITEKISKLECKIKMWKSRNLTFEGKSLIIKSFGISQFINVLQAYGISDSCLVKTERIIFGFVFQIFIVRLIIIHSNYF